MDNFSNIKNEQFGEKTKTPSEILGEKILERYLQARRAREIVDEAIKEYNENSTNKPSKKIKKNKI